MFRFEDIDEKISYRKCGCIVNEKQLDTKKYINLYVQITHICNAKCKFCSNACGKEIEKFNKTKFFEIFDELYKKVFINKVTFTGGEPTLNSDIYECIKYVRNKDKNILIFLDTNASNLKLLENVAPFVNSIALSRHHYDENLNNEVFGFNTSTNTELKNLPASVKSKINLRCNLIKGYIDNIEKCQKYLEWCSSINLTSVGFVKLMPYTDFAKEKFVDVDIKKLPNIIMTKQSKRPGICCCENYIYIANTGCVNIYRKELTNCHVNENTLVLSNNALLLGFNGTKLY